MRKLLVLALCLFATVAQATNLHLNSSLGVIAENTSYSGSCQTSYTSTQTPYDTTTYTNADVFLLNTGVTIGVNDSNGNNVELISCPKLDDTNTYGSTVTIQNDSSFGDGIFAEGPPISGNILLGPQFQTCTKLSGTSIISVASRLSWDMQFVDPTSTMLSSKSTLPGTSTDFTRTSGLAGSANDCIICQEGGSCIHLGLPATSSSIF